MANDAYDAAAVTVVQTYSFTNSIVQVLCDGEYFDHPLLDIVASDVTDLNLDTQVEESTSYNENIRDFVALHGGGRCHTKYVKHFHRAQ